MANISSERGGPRSPSPPQPPPSLQLAKGDRSTLSDSMYIPYIWITEMWNPRALYIYINHDNPRRVLYIIIFYGSRCYIAHWIVISAKSFAFIFIFSFALFESMLFENQNELLWVNSMLLWWHSHLLFLIHFPVVLAFCFSFWSKAVAHSANKKKRKNYSTYSELSAP